jgi:hypothetical protein
MVKHSDDETQSRIRLKIMGASGEEWHQEVTSVPRVGDQCSIWTNEKRITWSGTVASVNWCFAEDFNGAFVIIHLVDPDDKLS